MLPPDYPLPVLVVQHISAGFTAGLVRWLDQQVPLTVAIAQDGSCAPASGSHQEDVHLVLDGSMRLALDASTDPEVHRLSVDALLYALARAAGSGAVGVVLTGMGRDGAPGISAVRVAGGMTIAQDEPSSAVWGMSRTAAECGAEFILPLAEIGSTLSALGARRSVR